MLSTEHKYFYSLYSNATSRNRLLLCICCIRYDMYYVFIILSGVRRSPLITAATIGLLYQPQITDDGDR
jgi:hypothetical protein